MKAPKVVLFLGDLGRRVHYLVAILLVLSCGGPEVPADLPQAMEWRFDEPQPDWKVVTPFDLPIAPAEVSPTDDALRLTLTEETRNPNGHPGGGIYIELPDLTRRDWAEVVIRARTQNERSWVYAGFNLREEPLPRYPDFFNPFEELDWESVVPDGTVQTYRIPVDQIPWGWEGPWKQLGVYFDAASELGSIDILSVSLVPKDAAHRVSESTARKCLGMKSLNPEDLPNPTTVITWANVEAAQTEGEGSWTPLPEHCRIQGRMNERIGVNGQPYAIKFRMRLPTNWNGRFFFEGSGGANGWLSDAVGMVNSRFYGMDNGQGPPFHTALSLGYAVVNQDGGHDNRINNDSILNGTATFGFDPQARIDWGYNSLDEVTQAAKTLIKAYYGKLPDRSYYVGGSGGGREAMTMSQRFPTYFDGIVAINPGFDMPLAPVSRYPRVQAFAEVARAAGLYDEFGLPAVNKTITDDDVVLVANAVMERCDTLDGLADGLVDDFPACTTAVVGPRLAELTCIGVKEPGCLSAPQVTAFLKAYAALKNSQGEQLAAAQSWCVRFGGEGFGTGGGVERGAALIVTPPIPMPSFGPERLASQLAYDFDTDPQKAFATTDMYTESAWDYMRSSSTDLSAFKNRGSKLIIVTGVSDNLIPINDLINWWDEVNSINDGTAADFVRFFAVPGMTHGGIGSATNRFDALSAIVNWAENGITPDRIIAKARETTPWPGRTRPLCPWPQQARYKGSGSIEVADNFDCVDVVRN